MNNKISVPALTSGILSIIWLLVIILSELFNINNVYLYIPSYIWVPSLILGVIGTIQIMSFNQRGSIYIIINIIFILSIIIFPYIGRMR